MKKLLLLLLPLLFLTGCSTKLGGMVVNTGTIQIPSLTNTLLATDGSGYVIATSTPSSSGSVSSSTNIKTAYFLIENPTATEDDAFFIFNATSTITKVSGVNKTNGDTVTFNLYHYPARNTATSSADQVFATFQTITTTATPSTLTSFASSSASTNDVLRFVTSAASSSQFLITVNYYEN
jgi:hypothetical protein